MTLSRNSLALLLIFLAAFALSLWMSHDVFQQAPTTADEKSYRLQAELFAEGKLKREPPPFLQSFRFAMIVLDHEHGWFSRYPPGHTLWLVPGIWLGSIQLMIALAAGLGAVLTVKAADFLGIPRLWSALLLLISPYFLFTFGTFTSHTTGFTAAAGMLAAYIRWRQTGRHPWALLAGLFWAWFFLNRTYTAALIALPFAADSLWILWKHRTDKHTWTGTLCFAAAACTGILAILIYNGLMLGNPLKMTYLYYDHSDRLGFGWRHNAPVFPPPLPVHHTPARALRDLGANLLLLDQWLFGFRGGLLLLAALLPLGWSKRWSPLLIGTCLCVWFGYLLFWYPGWNGTGPSYYTENLPALILLAALGLSGLAKRLPARLPQFLPPLLTATLLLALALPFFRAQLDENRDRKRPRAAALHTLETAPPNSLIYITPQAINAAWKGHDLTFNPRGTDGPVIVARPNPPTDTALRRYYRDFTAYTLEPAGPDTFELRPLPPPPPILHNPRMDSLFRRTGTNTVNPDDPNALMRTATPAEHPADWLVLGRTYGLSPGAYTLELDLTFPTGAPEDPGIRIELHTQPAGTLLLQQEVPATPGPQTLTLPFTAEDFILVEPRIHYHARHPVHLRALRIRETPPHPPTTLTHPPEGRIHSPTTLTPFHNPRAAPTRAAEIPPPHAFHHIRRPAQHPQEHPLPLPLPLPLPHAFHNIRRPATPFAGSPLPFSPIRRQYTLILQPAGMHP